MARKFKVKDKAKARRDGNGGKKGEPPGQSRTDKRRKFAGKLKVDRDASDLNRNIKRQQGKKPR